MEKQVDVHQTRISQDVNALTNLIDHFALVAEGVILTTTGLYLAAWEFTGSDMDSLTPGELWRVANRSRQQAAAGKRVDRAV